MLNIGDRVPDFELLNQNGQPVRLSSFYRQPIVLFTFAKAGTPGCTIEACNIRDTFPALTTRDAVVLGIGDDQPPALLRWQQTHRLPYDLLSDPDHTVMEQLGAWGVGMFGLRLPLAQHTLWVLDAAGVVVERRVPVMPFEIGRRAEDALARLAPLSAAGD